MSRRRSVAAWQVSMPSLLATAVAVTVAASLTVPVTQQPVPAATVYPGNPAAVLLGSGRCGGKSERGEG